VLLKGLDDRGFVFYTNYNSRKAKELTATGRGSLMFYWRSLERQVRIDGRAEKVSAEESDTYFATRPLESRWSVYASRQSEVIESRETLESRFTIARQEYGDRVPRPAWWGGYRIVPERVRILGKGRLGSRPPRSPALRGTESERLRLETGSAPGTLRSGYRSMADAAALASPQPSTLNRSNPCRRIELGEWSGPIVVAVHGRS
jgi:hypothetical protein